MKTAQFPQIGSQGEISTLIEILHRAGSRLEVLTGGEVDSVVNSEGQTFVLQHAQAKIRQHEAQRQAAILDALPASIALLDPSGRIVSVNEAWRQFAGQNALRSPNFGIGSNYLAICASSSNDDGDAQQAEAGLRAVLGGRVNSFSLEYACHSPEEERWFLMMATPLSTERRGGGVVMHLDITERKQAEVRLANLNRIHTVLSRITSLILHVRNDAELYNEACRIAIEAGRFRIALIALVEPDTGSLKVVASTGYDERQQTSYKALLENPEDSKRTMMAKALRTRQALVSNDTRSYFKTFNLDHKYYIDSNIRSMAVFPLVAAGEAVGAILLGAGELDSFQGQDIEILTKVADDITYALDYLAKQERLNYLAYYDVLTGLPNRSLFLERVAQRIRRASQAGTKLVIALLDVERLRNINDSLGRPAGDLLLKQLSGWLGEHQGISEGLARIDADQFAVVLSGPQSELELLAFVRTLTRDLSAHTFQIGDAALRIAVKLGVALFPLDGGEADLLLKNAEAALKEAKADGERYLFYTPRMTNAVADKLKLENMLRLAIDRREFVLHYQPKVNVLSGKIIGAEALIRWNDPASGLVPPLIFIPILEETGLIHEVGRWALRQANADYLQWIGAGLPAVRIAVNVSPLQLRGNQGLVDDLRQIIHADPRSAAGLELEITESLIMGDIDHNIANLQAIRALGVTIAIDDFGTGFSSLSYLAKLPVDSLKIDRSFINDLANGKDGRALVSTIITLGHSLRLKIVAEGVETPDQFRVLNELGCDEMQGYLISKPIPASSFSRLLL